LLLFKGVWALDQKGVWGDCLKGHQTIPKHAEHVLVLNTIITYQNTPMKFFEVADEI
jgi:hypothetical protein